MTPQEREGAAYRELAKMLADFQQEHDDARGKALRNIVREGDVIFAEPDKAPDPPK